MLFEYGHHIVVIETSLVVSQTTVEAVLKGVVTIK